ncbi:SDR family oxidoreductase [Photobacterium swingsii]|uniref:SDR family oxidoreductase n=1 Tax=Photobacterium swingsii TaxID=680026 RepID=UPI003D0BFDC2
MSLYTVIGGNGFIGSELVSLLKSAGKDVYAPKRDCLDIFDKELGVVFYCAGFGECNKEPFNVLEANTVLLSDILKKSNFKRLIYISSTRVYIGQSNSEESADLVISHNDDRRLFNLTKLVSEELCLKSNKDCLIVRPSNVYGLALNSPLFLPSIVKDAVLNQEINMFVTKEYSKDYVSVKSLVKMLVKLSDYSGKHKVVNIAAGRNTSAIEIIKAIQEEQDCNINWMRDVKDEFFPETSVKLCNSLVTFVESDVLSDIKSMVKEFKLNLIDRKND